MVPSESTVKRLFALSGNRCAFPGCPHLLYDFDSAQGIGEICHIKGNKPKSARHDPLQSDADRQAFENLVLMCPTHHTIIDSNPATYTAEELTKLKLLHETSNSKPSLGFQPSKDLDEWLRQLPLFPVVNPTIVNSVHQTGGQVAQTITNVNHIQQLPPRSLILALSTLVLLIPLLLTLALKSHNSPTTPHDQQEFKVSVVSVDKEIPPEVTLHSSTGDVLPTGTKNVFRVVLPDTVKGRIKSISLQASSTDDQLRGSLIIDLQNVQTQYDLKLESGNIASMEGLAAYSSGNPAPNVVLSVPEISTKTFLTTRTGSFSLPFHLPKGIYVNIHYRSPKGIEGSSPAYISDEKTYLVIE